MLLSLPEEILFEILTYLPFIPLFTFRMTCTKIEDSFQAHRRRLFIPFVRFTQQNSSLKKSNRVDFYTYPYQLSVYKNKFFVLRILAFEIKDVFQKLDIKSAAEIPTQELKCSPLSPVPIIPDYQEYYQEDIQIYFLEEFYREETSLNYFSDEVSLNYFSDEVSFDDFSDEG